MIPNSWDYQFTITKFGIQFLCKGFSCFRILIKKLLKAEGHRIDLVN